MRLVQILENCNGVVERNKKVLYEALMKIIEDANGDMGYRDSFIMGSFQHKMNCSSMVDIQQTS